MDIEVIKRVLTAVFGTCPRIFSETSPENTLAWEIDTDYIVYEYKGKFYLNIADTKYCKEYDTTSGLFVELCTRIATDRVINEMEDMG